ncbi:hypothetical protein B0H34DRAFT_517144 [Crassisporium funariophilum]|nr:hypothetical protein B0H34DRAFT_517144 [Crassisporium funariophilum]
MAKKPLFVPKVPVEKLSLAVRKQIRDEFEAKREDLESQIAELLGYLLNVKIDVNAVWAYAKPDSSPGSVFYGYVDGFIYALKSFVEKFGDLGKVYFKTTVTANELSINANELGEEAESISADVKDGVFRILFHHDRLGYNQTSLADPLVKAINKAPHEGFSLLAKHSIATEYDPEIDDLREEIGTILNLPDVVLDANLEANYAKLLTKKDQDFEEAFGRATLAYFADGLKPQLKTQGFEGDEMLQEGFAEGIPSKTIRLRVVDSTTSGYCEVKIEEGVLYMQMPADRWYCNIYDAGSGILELL